MSEECFERAANLMQYAAGALMIGCSGEVFVHPNFSKMLKKVPYDYKYRTYFSSNFASNISEEQMHDIATSNISFINISMESIQPDVYEKMRRGAKYENFMRNLKTLRRILDEYPDPPKIHVTTVVTEYNYSEIKGIFIYMQDNFKITAHEFRTPHVPLNNVEYKNRLQQHPLITSALFEAIRKSVVDVDKQRRALFVDYNNMKDPVSMRSRDPLLPVVAVLPNGQVNVRLHFKSIRLFDDLCKVESEAFIEKWNAIAQNYLL
jgi:sulfatase maturation enzyme AslB (radical SAM superfamily)